MFAADLIQNDGFTIAAVVSTVLFGIATILAIIDRAFMHALIAAGLTALAFAFVLIS